MMEPHTMGLAHSLSAALRIFSLTALSDSNSTYNSVLGRAQHGGRAPGGISNHKIERVARNGEAHSQKLQRNLLGSILSGTESRCDV
jgi:hypothetical protein